MFWSTKQNNNISTEQFYKYCINCQEIIIPHKYNLKNCFNCLEVTKDAIQLYLQELFHILNYKNNIGSYRLKGPMAIKHFIILIYGICHLILISIIVQKNITYNLASLQFKLLQFKIKQLEFRIYDEFTCLVNKILHYNKIKCMCLEYL